jgi:hypothetical protein
MNETRNEWYAVGMVWLIVLLLLATMAGSVALVFTAFAHRDELPHVGRSIASPLPPTSTATAADQAAP